MSVSTVEKDPAKFAIAIQQLFAGRSNANGAVTLTTGTTTVVSAPNVAAQSAVFLSARSASAAAALAGAFISSVGKQTFTITHAAGAADRSFFWVALG